jgi:hypothetical protein
MTDRTLLWDDADYFILIPADDYERELREFRFVVEAKTLGEVRAAELPWWGDILRERFEEAKADDVGHAGPGALPDSEPWDLSAIVGESPFEYLTTPWDTEQLVEWLDYDLNMEHLAAGGGSPAGHIDTYKPRDRDAFFAALREAGYVLVQRPGLQAEYSDALDAVETRLG